MATRGLYIFSHNNKLGRAPAHKLFESIQVQLKDGVAVPRQFSDYTVVTPDLENPNLPEGVTLTCLCDG
jgi:CRISPR-associated protein Csd2